MPTNYLQKKKINFYEILNILEEIQVLETIGGIQTVNNLMKQSQVFISSFHYINFYLQEMLILIKENYIKRLMIQYGYNIIKLGYLPKISSSKIYDKALIYLNTTHNNVKKEDTNNLGKLITEFILAKQVKKKLYKNNDKDTENIRKDSLISGFKEFDKIIGGLSKGELFIIAGRPSTGKTSFAINIVNNIISNIKNIGIYFFSLEMSGKQILHKLISINSRITLNKITQYKLCTLEWIKIIELCYQMININLQIDDNPNISVDYIEYITYLFRKDNIPINLIIIDYLQLIQSNLTNKLNRSQELSYITRKLKLLAQTLNLPILVLSQLNRNIENRIDKTPVLSDLRESGCIDLLFLPDIKDKYEYKIHCVNIADRLLDLTEIKTKYKMTKSLQTQLNISVEYKFCYQINLLKEIFITHNHKFIFCQHWFKQHLITENFLLLKCNQSQYLKHINYCFPKTIKFSIYSKSYDLYIPTYFHFICENIILHNSIEQDADIITMIYNKEDRSKNHKKGSVLDFIICKNRNGPTGSFKLLFIPETTLFENYIDNK